MTSKTTKITIGAAAFVLLAAVGLYFLGQYLSDGQRLLDRFENAVDKGQPDKLLKLMASSEDGAAVERSTAEGIANYLQSDKEAMSAVLERLEKELGMLKNDSVPTFADEVEGAFVYVGKKEKKRWLLYDDYELKLRSYKVPVSTNFGGAKILLNGREAGTAGVGNSQLQLGPLLPGEYSIKAVYSGKYTTLENEVKAKVFPTGGTVETIDVPLKGEYVDIFANNSFARIFINGENIELAVGDGQRIGPIAVDGSNTIRLEVDYPWGTTASEERPIDGTRAEFMLPSLTEGVKEQVAAAVYSFASSWYTAFRERNADRLRNVRSDRKADLDRHFEEMISGGENYIGELLRAEIDLDSFRLNQLSESDYGVSVVARLEHLEAYYYGAFDLKPEPVAGTLITDYRLQYEGGEWVVSDWIDVGDAVMSSNLKTYLGAE